MLIVKMIMKTLGKGRLDMRSCPTAITTTKRKRQTDNTSEQCCDPLRHGNQFCSNITCNTVSPPSPIPAYIPWFQVLYCLTYLWAVYVRGGGVTHVAIFSSILVYVFYSLSFREDRWAMGAHCALDGLRTGTFFSFHTCFGA